MPASTNIAMIENALYTVSCVVCGRSRELYAVSFGHAFRKATADGSGWTWRRSVSGEHAELLCAEHAAVEKGVYGGR